MSEATGASLLDADVAAPSYPAHKPLIGAKELAEVLRVDVRVVRLMARNRQIPYYPVGSRKRFSVEDVLGALHQPAAVHSCHSHIGESRRSGTRHHKVMAVKNR